MGARQPVRASGSPFDLADASAYRRWRERKLDAAPRRVEELVVPVRDPRALAGNERTALVERCARANMALYVSATGGIADKEIPRALAAQLGLARLDANWLADDDGITPLAVAEAGARPAYIPYTNRPIQWHTDGYYNPPDRQIRAMVLHCVERAESGGENRLLDHELAYILLRDEDPSLVAALMAPDAMSVPAREDEGGGVARGEQPGPVFSVAADGRLHMRYTARTRSIAWKDDAPTRAAAQHLARLLASDLPWILSARLEPGMGLVCNNVLHDRAAFADSPQRRRLLYRARYYDAVAER